VHLERHERALFRMLVARDHRALTSATRKFRLSIRIDRGRVGFPSPLVRHQDSGRAVSVF